MIIAYQNPASGRDMAGKGKPEADPGSGEGWAVLHFLILPDLQV